MALDSTNVCKNNMENVLHNTYTTHRLDSIRYLKRQLPGRELQRRRIHRFCHHYPYGQHQGPRLCSSSQCLGRCFLCRIFCRLRCCQRFQLCRISDLVCCFLCRIIWLCCHDLCFCKPHLCFLYTSTCLTFIVGFNVLCGFQQAQLCHWCRIQRCQLHEHRHQVSRQLCLFRFQECHFKPCCLDRWCRCCWSWIRQPRIRCRCCCYGSVNFLS